MPVPRSRFRVRPTSRLAGSLLGAVLTSFALATTASAATVFAPTAQPLDPAVRNDGRPIEVGMRFRSEQAGYITALRFWKGAGNTGTHIGHLWNAAGQQVAEARYTAETASGWQEVSLSAPVPVSANAVYTVSYHSAGGGYSFDPNYFTAPIHNPPLHALADAEGGNGVYGYGFIAFPFQAFRQANYWVDAVFSTIAAPDTAPPRIVATTPLDGTTGSLTTTEPSVRFDEPMNAATITSATVRLHTAGGTPVPADVTYSAAKRTARLVPQAPLSPATTYVATVQGGLTGVTDAAGNPMPSTPSWSFTTAAAHAVPADDGPGGPILVVTSADDPFGRYFGEILSAEGLNAYRQIDVSRVTAATLAGYRAVVLAKMPLTDAQVTMLSDWVAGGGNLVAMRPDKKLSALLGLSDAGGTLADRYLRVDTTRSPGAGIVGETMQFHSTADRYRLDGARSVAELYSSASAADGHPAVSINDHGTGGQAAAFTYDLARSVVLTRQGNPAWAGDDRDGTRPIRSNDLFFGEKAGDVQPDWVDPDRIAIPQADEQQRLLANLITDMMRDRMPLPRFWYLPHGKRAAVVMTGDDHGAGGTVGQFERFESESPAGCSVADWECIRATSYVATNVGMTDAQVAGYEADGFEIALHPHTQCSDYTPASLEADFARQYADFQARWASVDAARTNRTHCVVWSDWATQPKVARGHGIRLDTNYYYYPCSWAAQRPGLYTGSGLPMRFADLDGSLIDVFQATSQLTDESCQDIPAHIAALLDRALGQEGYYGTFVANMHTDRPDHAGANAIVSAAKARGVPVVSAAQLLDWLDGRNGSSFDELSFSGNQLRFRVSRPAGLRGLEGMVPRRGPDGPLTGLTRDGQPVTATNRTVKGVEYAVFDAAPGDYVAGYGSDPTPPAISALRATPNADGTATVTWRTDEPSTSRVRFGTSAESLTGDAGASALVRDHSVTLTGLSAATRYSYRVSSADAAGAVASSPAASDAPASFVTAGPTMADTTVADFTAGTTADTAVQRAGDGEVALRPAVGEEFDGDGLPLSFMSVPWGTGGAATVSGGALRVDGARTGPQATFGPGRSLEFSATFRPDVFQFAGFGVELWTTPWAIFSSAGPSGQLYARSNNGTQSEQSTPIPGVHSGVPHRYRIDWTPTGFVYWVDGVQVASHAVATSTAMRPIVSDHYAGGGDISVAWLRMSPHATPGTYTSRVLDAGAAGTRWLELEATATTPAGTQIDLSTRSGGTATPDDGWTSWRPVAASGAIASPAGRYIQYRAELSTSAPSVTPALERVQVHYALDSDPNHPPTAGTVGLAPAAPTTAGTLTATPSGFSDPDGDSLDYRYRWLRNGTAIAGQTGDSLDLSAAGHGDRGDTVTVEVTATDGSALSPSASAAATIANAAPTRGTVALSPSAPRTDSTLTATVSGFGDADGDALTYEYRWLRDDAPIAGATAATLDLSAPGHGDADDEIAVEVTAVDAGGARSAAAGADVTIAPADTTAPVISARTATVEGDNGIAITWRTDEPASSRVQYGTSAGALTGEASAAALVTEHRIVLRGLAPGTLHHFRAVSADESGNGTTSPAAAQAPDTFTTPPARFLDSSMADFAAGTRSATHVGGTSHTADGEVVLRPQIGEEFEGAGLPSGWGFDTWNDGVDPTVGGGVLRTDGARVGTGDFFAPGRSLEFVGTFGGSVFQHVGLGYGLWGAPWAIFSTYDDSDDVYARTNATGTDVVTRIDGVDGSQPHRYRIDWTSTGFEYWIDGTRVATHATPIEAEMRPLVSDYYNGGGRTSVAWLRMTPYAAAGTFTSRVFDAGAAGSTWQTLESDADVPAGTALTLETRSGDAPTPDATWSGWQPLGAGGAIASPAGRHLQYRATLTSSASASSPTLRRAEIAYAPAP